MPSHGSVAIFSVTSGCWRGKSGRGSQRNSPGTVAEGRSEQPQMGCGVRVSARCWSDRSVGLGWGPFATRLTVTYPASSGCQSREIFNVRNARPGEGGHSGCCRMNWDGAPNRRRVERANSNGPWSGRHPRRSLGRRDNGDSASPCRTWRPRSRRVARKFA